MLEVWKNFAEKKSSSKRWMKHVFFGRSKAKFCSTTGSIQWLWLMVIPLFWWHHRASILKRAVNIYSKYQYNSRPDFIELLMLRRWPRVEVAARLISHLKRLPSPSGSFSRIICFFTRNESPAVWLRWHAELQHTWRGSQIDAGQNRQSSTWPQKAALTVRMCFYSLFFTITTFKQCEILKVLNVTEKERKSNLDLKKRVRTLCKMIIKPNVTIYSFLMCNHHIFVQVGTRTAKCFAIRDVHFLW